MEGPKRLSLERRDFSFLSEVISDSHACLPMGSGVLGIRTQVLTRVLCEPYPLSLLPSSTVLSRISDSVSLVIHPTELMYRGVASSQACSAQASVQSSWRAIDTILTSPEQSLPVTFICKAREMAGDSESTQGGKKNNSPPSCPAW